MALPDGYQTYIGEGGAQLSGVPPAFSRALTLAHDFLVDMHTFLFSLVEILKHVCLEQLDKYVYLSGTIPECRYSV